MSVLVGWYNQIWPNIAANLIWVIPTLIINSRLVKAFVDDALERHHAKIIQAVPGSETVAEKVTEKVMEAIENAEEARGKAGPDGTAPRLR